MQKKIMWAVLGTLLAVVIASIALVFTVEHKSSAATIDENKIVTISDWDDFQIHYDSYLGFFFFIWS